MRWQVNGHSMRMVFFSIETVNLYSVKKGGQTRLADSTKFRETLEIQTDSKLLQLIAGAGGLIV